MDWLKRLKDQHKMKPEAWWIPEKQIWRVCWQKLLRVIFRKLYVKSKESDMEEKDHFLSSVVKHEFSCGADVASSVGNGLSVISVDDDVEKDRSCGRD